MLPTTHADTLVDQVRSLLVPRSIAVVGASSDLSKVTGAEFDDIVTWISPSMLFNRMIAAGQLP